MTAPLSSEPLAEFSRWLRNNAPAGTVISDPDWWAPRIFRVVQDAIQSTPSAGPSARTSNHCRNCGIPLPLQPGTAHWSGCPSSPLYKPPTRRQIVFNWLMGEPDFATKAEGWWGSSEEVESIDELLAALDPKAFALEAENRKLRAALNHIANLHSECYGRPEVIAQDAQSIARAALQEKS